MHVYEHIWIVSSLFVNMGRANILLQSLRSPALL